MQELLVRVEDFCRTLDAQPPAYSYIPLENNEERIRDLGDDPFEYRPLPAQVAMFNAIEGLSETCQRVAGFLLAGESVATCLTRKPLATPTVPDRIKQPYRKIT